MRRFAPAAGTILATALIIMLALGQAQAVPPSKETKEKWISEGVWEQKVDNWKQFKAAGGGAPAVHPVINPKKLISNRALGIDAVDTVRVIVIMVDFDDHVWNGSTYGQQYAVTGTQFDSILFSDRETDVIINPTGSMTDFYMENSYGQFYIQGDIFGWLRMPQTYAYYEQGVDGMGSHAQILALHAVQAADAAGADYSNYDYDNDGYCDGVILIHAGGGAEAGYFGIWSHNWVLPSPQVFDGVTVYGYNINPEENFAGPSPIGVFCHEYGHFLGLPDLYDIDYEPSTSDGLGKWSLMAGGSYNGSSRSPAHFDAYCKADLGFVDVIDVTTNLHQAELPAIEYNPVIYKLHNAVTSPFEFFLIENRQQMGFDAALPGDGILIYHVDSAVAGSNNNPYNYFVALEQADGRDDLAFTDGNSGDDGDPFPGYYNVRSWHNLTTPSSDSYQWGSGTETNIGVWDISDNDSVMYADLDIELSRPYVVLSGIDSILFDDPVPYGDGNGDLDPGDTVLFYCSVRNLMREAYNPVANLSTNNPHITILENDMPLSGNLGGITVGNSANPIKLFVHDTVKATIDSFFLTITADSLP